MGAPWGWYGVEECIKSVVLKHNRINCHLFPQGKVVASGGWEDGSPMGVVRRGGVHIVCRTEAQ